MLKRILVLPIVIVSLNLFPLQASQASPPKVRPTNKAPAVNIWSAGDKAIGHLEVVSLQFVNSVAIFATKSVEAQQAEAARQAALTSSSYQPSSAPGPVSSSGCGPGPIKDEIDQTFGSAAAWAESIVVRESGCQPGAQNPSGASGLFQLLGHQDILAAVCPNQDPSVSWANPDCNIRAAKSLYDGSGTDPWKL